MEEKKSIGKFVFTPSSTGEAAYLRLPTFPVDRVGCSKKVVRLHDCLGKYDGPDVYFNFDDHGVMIGIEILY